jgi:hypothetical protein
LTRGGQTEATDMKFDKDLIYRAELAMVVVALVVLAIGYVVSRL